MIVHTNNKSPAIVAPSFDAHAKRIGKSYESFDIASAKLSAVVLETMQAFIDSCGDLPRDKKGCDALGKAIRDCETVKGFTESGFMERKTFTEYAQSAMRAHFHGVPFSPALKNDKSMGLPWGKVSGKDGATSSGAMVSTSREALDKTICKALQQMRLLGLTELAANTLDLMIDSLDNFSESI